MPQTMIRIIYDKQSLSPKRFIIPDDDSQLNKFHNAESGEDSLDITNSQWENMNTEFGPRLEIVTRYIKSVITPNIIG